VHHHVNSHTHSKPIYKHAYYIPCEINVAIFLRFPQRLHQPPFTHAPLPTPLYHARTYTHTHNAFIYINYTRTCTFLLLLFSFFHSGIMRVYDIIHIHILHYSNPSFFRKHISLTKRHDAASPPPAPYTMDLVFIHRRRPCRKIAHQILYTTTLCTYIIACADRYNMMSGGSGYVGLQRNDVVEVTRG